MKRIHTSIIFAGIGLIFLLGPNVQAAATVEGDDTFSQQLPIQEPDLQIGIPTIRFTPAEELIKQNQTEGERLLHVPYLAEYIRDVYKYAIAVAGVLSIIMIIFAGFQWVLSGGNPEGINASKKRIGNALIGLVLALGSYTLLYTINPALVEFRSLKILFIEPEILETIDKGASLDPEIAAAGSGQRYTATVIALQGDKGGKKVVARLKTLGASGNQTFVPPAHPENCPLDFPDKRFKVQAPDTQTTPQSLGYTGFDQLFQTYGSCLEVDWRVLKAIASIESTFRSAIKNTSGFTGLFQTKTKNCIDALKEDNMENECTDAGLINPEVSTAVATAMIRKSIQLIKQNCQDIDFDSLYYFIYTGHHSGRGVLKNVLEKTCSYQTACTHIYQSWNLKSAYQDNTPPACAQP